MDNLGKKHMCTNPACGIKFYDLGKAEPVCPKCKRKISEQEEKQLLEKKVKKVLEEDEQVEETEEKEPAEPEELEEEEYIEEKIDTFEEYEFEE